MDNGSAKRLECVQLAGAFERFCASESGSKLRAVQRLRHVRGPKCVRCREELGMKCEGWARRRAYEREALVAVRRSRTMVLLWARQCRKSTALGVIAFDELSRGPHRNVIAASASLLVGSELVGKSVSTVEEAARGWTGTVLRDEAGFTPAALEAELEEAVKPIIDADPSFRLVRASNLPADDSHPFFVQSLYGPRR